MVPDNSRFEISMATPCISCNSWDASLNKICAGNRKDRIMHDVRYALRQLQRNPGFAIAAILTLGLGIGANTAVFSIVNTILLKPLPYKNSDRLVRIVENIPAGESFSGAPERTIGMSPMAFEEWRSKTKTLSAMAMERQVSMTLMARQPVR